MLAAILKGSEPLAEPQIDIQSRRVDRRTFWLSVVASIIASVLFGIFFQPIVAWINNIAVAAIGIFYQGYIDNIYNQAAQSPVDLATSLIFQTIMLFPLLILLGVGAFRTGMIVRLHANASPSGKTTITASALLIFLWGIMSLLTLVIVSAGIEYSITINTKFQRQLMALTPVISVQERNEILGRWAMMKSKADYENIRRQVESLAAQHHTTLPSLR
jgi:hypothetical protein